MKYIWKSLRLKAYNNILSLRVGTHTMLYLSDTILANNVKNGNNSLTLTPNNDVIIIFTEWIKAYSNLFISSHFSVSEKHYSRGKGADFTGILLRVIFQFLTTKHLNDRKKKVRAFWQNHYLQDFPGGPELRFCAAIAGYWEIQEFSPWWGKTYWPTSLTANFFSFF